MKIEDQRNIRESLEVIKESIQRGISDRQRNIGFNVSVASVEMLEVYLHSINLLNPSSIIKHEWFGSIRRANEKLPFEFEDKVELIKLLCEIELKRNFLCYGRPQPIETIQEILTCFNRLKDILEAKGLKWN